MPKLDLNAIEQVCRTGYPPPYDEAVARRLSRKIGDALGFQDFGITETTLMPGAWSSQRHWHEGEDELVVMLEGEAVLVEEGSRAVMRPGDLATFCKGVPNGHHLVNESDRPCRFIAVGRVATSDCHYPDVDMHLDGKSGQYVRKSELR